MLEYTRSWKTAAEGKWTAVKITPALFWEKRTLGDKRRTKDISMEAKMRMGNGNCAAGAPASCQKDGQRGRECVNQVNRSDAIRDYYAITQDTINNARQDNNCAARRHICSAKLRLPYAPRSPGSASGTGNWEKCV